MSNSFDFLGNIVIIKFPEKTPKSKKIKIAREIIKKNKSVKTVLEKSERIKGRLRKFKTNYILGEKTKEAIYKENGCIFKFNVDKTYFSPRLSNERKEIASQIKKEEKVLVMFAGVAPFSIVIAKNSNAKIIYSNEINKEANEYAKINIELNKVQDKVKLIPGDIKKICQKLKEKKEIFDVIVMPRPQLKYSFLKEALELSKKNTRIYYYDFCKINEIDKVKKKIEEEARLYDKKIKILRIKKAGEIAPYKIRLRIDFIITN